MGCLHRFPLHRRRRRRHRHRLQPSGSRRQRLVGAGGVYRHRRRTSHQLAAARTAFNAITNTCNPLDDNNHGSHVSGTIGATGNNAIGVVGVNWVASIMGAKFLDSGGSGSTANAINAIEFTIQAKAIFLAPAANVRVLSNSWGGGGFSQALLDENQQGQRQQHPVRRGRAATAAATNDVTPNYRRTTTRRTWSPSPPPTTTTCWRASRVSAATTVDLGAPGVDVLSTPATTRTAISAAPSMATPHVSGAAALVLSACALDTAGVKNNLLTNVDTLGSLSGRVLTNGRLNVNKAIRACSAPPTADFSVSATPASQTVVQGASTTYTATVTPSGGFTGTVTFSASGLPSGASASFNPTSVTTSGSSTMTVTTATTTTAGIYLITITGTSGRPGSRHSAIVTLVVNAPATAVFTLSASPASHTDQARIRRQRIPSRSREAVVLPDSVNLSVSGTAGGSGGFIRAEPATGTWPSSTLTVTTGAVDGGGPRIP